MAVPPKSSILRGFSIIFTIHFGGFPPILGNPPYWGHVCVFQTPWHPHPWSTMYSYRLEYPPTAVTSNWGSCVGNTRKLSAWLLKPRFWGFPTELWIFTQQETMEFFLIPKQDPCGTGMIYLHFSVDFYPWDWYDFPTFYDKNQLKNVGKYTIVP